MCSVTFFFTFFIFLLLLKRTLLLFLLWRPRLNFILPSTRILAKINYARRLLPILNNRFRVIVNLYLCNPVHLVQWQSSISNKYNICVSSARLRSHLIFQNNKILRVQKSRNSVPTWIQYVFHSILKHEIITFFSTNRSTEAKVSTRKSCLKQLFCTKNKIKV